jgi:putative addiction module CopG family antidote
MKPVSLLKRYKLTLPSELSQFLEEQVAKGEYHVPAEAIVEALWLLRNRKMTVEERRADLQNAILAGINSGEATEWNADEFRQQAHARLAEYKRAHAIEDLQEVMTYLYSLERTTAEKVVAEAVSQLPSEKRGQIIHRLFKITDAVDTVEGIREGLENIKAGKGRPFEEFFEELRKELGIPAYLNRSYIQTLQWVSVAERLPETTGSYLVASSRGTVAVADWYEENRWSVGRDEVFVAQEISCWMPLPTPPEPESEKVSLDDEMIQTFQAVADPTVTLEEVRTAIAKIPNAATEEEAEDPEALDRAMAKMMNRTPEEIEAARAQLFQASRPPRELPEGKTLEDMISGKWPGDETGEEVLRALEKLS